jgi:hypothetical protein
MYHRTKVNSVYSNKTFCTLKSKITMLNNKRLPAIHLSIACFIMRLAVKISGTYHVKDILSKSKI